MEFKINSNIIVLLLIAVLSLSCVGKFRDKAKEPILEVGGKYLYRDDIDNIVPKNSTLVDSANIVDRYVKKWVLDVLLYENAKRNISTTSEKIEKLVDEYRKSLVIYEYEQTIINQRLDTVVPLENKKRFYDQYKKNLILDKNLIKGVLLITPQNTPQLDEVRKWVRQSDYESLEKIEKYSLKNAVSYDMFLDSWKDFDEISKKIPLDIKDLRNFVRSNSFVEKNDTLKHYFLKISNSLTKGDIMPFEYAEVEITNIIVNRNRIDFIKDFENSIYHDAIKNKDITYFKKR